MAPDLALELSSGPVPSTSSSDSPSNLFTVITSSSERFTLTLSQIRFDSPNYFTVAFERDFEEASTRTVHLPNRRADVFEHISNWLAGEDIFPVKVEGETDERALELVMEYAQYFMLDGLKKSADAAMVYLRPAIPGFPIDDSTLALFDSVADFQRACWFGMVGEEKLDVILKKKDGPFTLFHFKELQLSVARIPSGSSYAISYKVAFQRPSEAVATTKVGKQLSGYPYERSATTFRYKTLSSTWQQLSNWLQSRDQKEGNTAISRSLSLSIVMSQALRWLRWISRSCRREASLGTSSCTSVMRC